MTLPVVAQRWITEMILMPKKLPDEWQKLLFSGGHSDGSHERHRIYLQDQVEVGPVRGRFFVFRRIGHVDPSRDWTVGLGLHDLQGNDYRLVRCNGAHGGHTNRLERQALPVGPHVHYLREDYLRRWPTKHDGFAVETAAFSSIVEALDHLTTVTNMAVPGRLWTVDR